MDLCAVVLAAGDGKRMRARRPKVLCEVLSKPMLAWVVSALREAGIEKICIVCQPGDQEAMEAAVEGPVQFAFQTERRGTGHATAQASDFLKQHQGDCIILCGDAPLMDSQTILSALRLHREKQHAATVISAVLPDPTGYGRILRDGETLLGIREERDASQQERAITEINAGAYLFSVPALLSVLPRLTAQNAQGEYYLTDSISLLREEGLATGVSPASSPDAAMGANSPRDLLRLNERANQKMIDRQLDAGVRFLSLDGVLISPDVKIGAGTEILPGTILRGRVRIGTDCVIGPGTVMEDCTVGDGCTINASQLYHSTVGNGVRIGPFSHIRPGSQIEDGVKIGDFVEIKNSSLGNKTSVAHLTYIGDSDVGSHVNFGCGTVTVNYNGVSKFRTKIGSGAFIGCNTNLIAPVEVGEGAYTAAGTTVTETVPPGAMAIGRARQENKEDYANRILGSVKKAKDK